MALSWLLLPLLAVAVNSQNERVQPPTSPCPGVYTYGWMPGTGWHGVITIVPPNRFSEVQLTVRQSLPYYHPEAGVGRVEVKGGDAAIQEISRKAIRGIPQKIQYNLIFPPFRELPRIASIVFNGKDFCPTQQVFSDTKGRIELKYVLKSGLSLPISPGSSFSVATDTDLQTVGIPPHETRPTEESHQGYQPSTTKEPFHQGYQPSTTEPPVEVFVIEFGPNKPHITNSNSNVGGSSIQGGERPTTVHFENPQHVSGTERPSDQPFTRPTVRPSGGSQVRPKPIESQQNRPKPTNSIQHVSGTIRPVDSSQHTRPKPINNSQHFSGTKRPGDHTQQHRPIDNGQEVDGIQYPSTDSAHMSMSALDERVLQLLTAISKGETVATSRIEQLLTRLIELTRRRLDLEMKRLKIEEERLHLEATSV